MGSIKTKEGPLQSHWSHASLLKVVQGGWRLRSNCNGLNYKQKEGPLLSHWSHAALLKVVQGGWRLRSNCKWAQLQTKRRPFAEPLVAERGWRLRSNCKWAQLQTKRSIVEPKVAERGWRLRSNCKWAQLQTKRRPFAEPLVARITIESGAGLNNKKGSPANSRGLTQNFSVLLSAILLCRGVTGVCALLLCATFWADT
ncbi:MAG: hypothetical protein J6B18_00295 [Bacteroidaceae bacterium]|nr:hypothetical protein [Bacteroidaceae bacterium]